MGTKSGVQFQSGKVEMLVDMRCDYMVISEAASLESVSPTRQ